MTVIPPLQLQIDKVEKSIAHKRYKGISFAILANNTLEYVNIPSVPAQRFIYFENTSKLTNEDRNKIKLAKQSILLASPKVLIVDPVEVLDTVDIQ